MKELVKKYSATAMLLVFFILSCTLAYCPLGLKLSIIAASFLFAAVSLVPHVLTAVFGADRAMRRAVVLMAASAAVASGISAFAFDYYADRISANAGKTELVRLYISETEREYPHVAYYNAIVEESESLPTGVHIILSTPITGLETGSIVEGEVTFSPLEAQSTSVFDGKRYYLPKRIMITAEAEVIDKIGVEERFSLSGMFTSWRNRLASAIRAHCGKDAGELASAVLLGARDGLDQSVKRDFRRLGISHLLAISGMHFSSIIALLEFVMRRMRLRPRVRAAVNIVFALLFMGLTGFTSSVARAGIMHIIAQFAVIVSRRSNIVNSYALSGALLILINPFSAVDIGFQLSFTSSLGCIVYLLNRGAIAGGHGKSGRRGIFAKILPYVRESVLFTVTVTLFTLPLNWLYFGELSLASIPVNIVAVPLVTLFMLLSAAYLILYPLVVFILPLASLIDLLGGFLIKSAARLSSIGGVVIGIDYAFTPVFVGAIVVLLILFPICGRKRAVAVSTVSVFAVLVALSLAVTAADRRNTYFSYVSSGDNEGFVVKSDGKVLICDMSNASFGFSYELLNEAHSLHSTEIEALTFTHYHNKHISYFGNVCEREIVRSVVLPEPQTKTERAVYAGICDTADEYGVTVYTLAEGEGYSVGDASVSISPRDYLKRSSHPVSGAFVRVLGDDIVLLSSSFDEADGRYDDAIAESEYIILGDHSPICKENFTLPIDAAAVTVIAGEDAAVYLDEDTCDALGERLVLSDLVRLKW